MIIGEIGKTVEQPAERQVARGVVLHVLTNVPPWEQSGEGRHLGCLAYIARLIASLLAGRARCCPYGLLRTAALAGLAYGCLRLAAQRCEPRLVPVDEAARLTAAVGCPIAAQLEMDRVLEATAASPIDGVACLVGALEYLEALAAIGEHLRHEGQLVQPAVAVERRQNFLFAANFDPVARLQLHFSDPATPSAH